MIFLSSYFRKGLCFGLACFANMPVESELERGARMKSVGILSPSYTLLYRYMHFLENQVRYVMEKGGNWEGGFYFSTISGWSTIFSLF